jgi:protein-tyrosine phosphatase
MRDLDWPDCSNARDVGGLGNVRTGALYRSDGLFLLTDEGIAAVRASGVSRILDLRWATECETEPSPFAADPMHVHVPFLEDVITYEAEHHTYGPMLDHNQRRIAVAFRALATAPPGAVLVHCHAGRDRTAVLIELALAICGVPPAEIVDDYGLSPERPREAMINTLEHLERRYGGAERYLIHIGVPPSDVEAVRRRLLGSGRRSSARMVHE